WSNNLNPDLCKDPINEDEKIFIVQCADQNMQNEKFLTKIVDLTRKEYKKLFSENKIKNFLHTRKRRLDRIQELPKLEVYEPKPFPPQSNIPPMKPIFD
ncbi:1324_t:CDS:2, partial [Funneliformis caledonium]